MSVDQMLCKDSFCIYFMYVCHLLLKVPISGKQWVRLDFQTKETFYSRETEANIHCYAQVLDIRL